MAALKKGGSSDWAKSRAGNAAKNKMVCLEFVGGMKITSRKERWTLKMLKFQSRLLCETIAPQASKLGQWWYGCSKFQLAKYRLSYFGTTRCFESLSLQGTPSFISHILQTPSCPQSFHKNLSRFLPLSTWHLFPIHDYSVQLSQAPLPEDPSTSWSPTSTWATQHCPACLSPTDHSQSTHKSLAPFPSLWRM